MGVSLHDSCNRDPRDKLVSILRSFPADAQLIDVATVFNEELRASMDESRCWVPSSRMGMMSDKDYERESARVERISKLWDGSATLTPEELLKRVMAKNPFDEMHWPWKTVQELIKCKHFLTTSIAHNPTTERSTDLRLVGILTMHLNKLLKDVTVVQNPLVGLATARREQKDAESVASLSELDLRDMEFLSTNLWHMATTLDVETLRARLLLMKKNAYAVELLYLFHEYAGLPEPEGPVFFVADLGSYGSWEDLDDYDYCEELDENSPI